MIKTTLSAAAALLMAGCAAHVSTPADEPTGAPPNHAQAAETARVAVPGSRILRRVDPDNPMSGVGASPVNVYGQDALDGTGAIDIADAVEELDSGTGSGGG